MRVRNENKRIDRIIPVVPLSDMTTDMSNLTQSARSLLIEGRKIQAMKMVIQSTGWGLQETNELLKQILNEIPPVFPDSYQEALQIIEERLPSIRNKHYKTNVQELLDSAERDLGNVDLFRFPNWNSTIELEAYESDLEILDIVFKDTAKEGDVIVLGHELEAPLHTDFARLYQDIEDLPVNLLPFDMVFIWKDKPIITIVGHWGVYAHLEKNAEHPHTSDGVD